MGETVSKLPQQSFGDLIFLNFADFLCVFDEFKDSGIKKYLSEILFDYREHAFRPTGDLHIRNRLFCLIFSNEEDLCEKVSEKITQKVISSLL